MAVKKKTTNAKPLPAGTIKVSGELNKRLTDVANKSGIAKNKLSELLLSDIVGRLEQGGRLTVNLEDGSINIQAPPPQIQPQSIQPAYGGRQMTEDAGPRKMSIE